MRFVETGPDHDPDIGELDRDPVRDRRRAAVLCSARRGGHCHRDQAEWIGPRTGDRTEKTLPSLTAPVAQLCPRQAVATHNPGNRRPLVIGSRGAAASTASRPLRDFGGVPARESARRLRARRKTTWPAGQQYASAVPGEAFGIFVLGMRGGGRRSGSALSVVSEAAFIGAVSSPARGGCRRALEGAVRRPVYYSCQIGEGGLLHPQTIEA